MLAPPRFLNRILGARCRLCRLHGPRARRGLALKFREAERSAIFRVIAGRTSLGRDHDAIADIDDGARPAVDGNLRAFFDQHPQSSDSARADQRRDRPNGRRTADSVIDNVAAPRPAKQDLIGIDSAVD